MSTTVETCVMVLILPRKDAVVHPALGKGDPPNMLILGRPASARKSRSCAPRPSSATTRVTNVVSSSSEATTAESPLRHLRVRIDAVSDENQKQSPGPMLSPGRPDPPVPEKQHTKPLRTKISKRPTKKQPADDLRFVKWPRYRYGQEATMTAAKHELAVMRDAVASLRIDHTVSLVADHPPSSDLVVTLERGNAMVVACPLQWELVCVVLRTLEWLTYLRVEQCLSNRDPPVAFARGCRGTGPLDALRARVEAARAQAAILKKRSAPSLKNKAASPASLTPRSERRPRRVSRTAVHAAKREATLATKALRALETRSNVKLGADDGARSFYVPDTALLVCLAKAISSSRMRRKHDQRHARLAALTLFKGVLAVKESLTILL